MSDKMRIILIVIVIATDLFTFRQIRLGRLSLNHSLLWMFSSLVLLLIAIFPGIAYRLSSLLGIGLPINMILLSFSFFSMIMFIYLTNVVSRGDRMNRRLTQQIAMMEKRIRELEANATKTNSGTEQEQESAAGGH